MAQVIDVLKTLAREATGADLAPDQPLMSAGLDSLGAIELRNGVASRFGVTLPATVAFDYPTIQVQKTICVFRSLCTLFFHLFGRVSH